jgi:hypothetical protein
LDHQKVDWGLHKLSCLYNPDTCEVCGKREGLQSCTGCFHRKYCCQEHQTQTWKDHKTICNASKELGLASKTDPEDTANALTMHSLEPTFGHVRPELALRVQIDAFALTKYFGLTMYRFACLLNFPGVLVKTEKFDEAEIFARDAVNCARDELHDVFHEFQTAATLAAVLVEASKPQETIELCDHYLELKGTENSEGANRL